MNKELFLEYLQYYKDFDFAIRRVENAFAGPGNRVELFETDWYSAVDKMLSVFLEHYFTEKGLDIIYSKIFDPFVDEYNTEIGEKIWEKLISNKELYFINE